MEVNLPFLLCFTVYLRAIFQVQAPGGLIFGGAYFQNFTVFIRLFCLFFFGVSCRYMSLANFTGIPGLTLPVGYDDHGLPIALQVMSSWWNEHVLLRVSHAAEGFTPKTKPQVHYNLLE